MTHQEVISMSVISRIREVAANRERRAEEKAATQLKKARSKLEREKARSALKRERMLIRQQLAEDEAATAEAERRARDTRRRAGHLTPDERVSRVATSVGRGIASGVKAYRSVSGDKKKSKSPRAKKGASLDKFIRG